MNERSIFLDALELSDPEARRKYLDQACGDDQELRRQVERLLVSHNEASSFLEKPPAGLAATIAGGVDDTVGESLDSDSLEFLEPSEKPGCLGTISQYEVVEAVGRGGMGLVLRAYDTKLNRVVAIKAMAPELAANPMAVKRFLREARAAAAVSHDHVVTIHAIEEGSRQPYIVMEYVDGQSLQEKIDRTGGLELKEILRIGRQMARGLSAAHEQGLVHRDIKPANILLENGVERVKLTDFGLARAVDDVSVTQTGQIAGTPQFMSPEQANGHSLDARSDLFSLGSVLYTMCSGRPPFRADTAVAMLRRVTDDDPRPIREGNSDIPDWLEAIIFKLLAKDPDERFQSADDVADLFGEHLAYLQHPTTAPKPRLMAHAARESGVSRVAGAKKASTSASTNPLPITFALCFTASLSILAFVFATTLLMSGLRFGLPNWLRLWMQFGGLGSLPVAVAVFILADRSERKNSHRSAVIAGLLNLLPLNPLVVVVLPLTIWTLLRLRHPSAKRMYEQCPPVDHEEERRRWPLVITTLACLLIAFCAAITIYVQTDYGTIRVTVNDPNTTVTVDNEQGLSFENTTGQGTLRVRAGEHRLRIKQNDLEFETDVFRVRRGEAVLLSVELIEGKLGARLNTGETRRVDGGSVSYHYDRVIGMQRALWPDAATDSQEFLQGTWRAVSVTDDGRPLPDREFTDRRMTFTGDSFTGPMKRPPRPGKFALDVSKEPKQIDLHFPAEGQDQLVVPGIYRLEGDRLTICISAGLATSERPTDFTSNSGSKQSLMAFERVSDRELLQGVWRVIALEGGGAAAPEQSFQDKRFLVNGDRISLTGKTDDLRPFRLNAGASPKQMDFAANREGELSGKAIYELDGDTLRFCFSQRAQDSRPTSFDTKGTTYFCYKLRREQSGSVEARQNDTENSLGMTMRLIPKGQFQIGTAGVHSNRCDFCTPAHQLPWMVL